LELDIHARVDRIRSIVPARGEHQRRGAPAHAPAFLLAAGGKLREILGERFVEAGRLRREQGRQRIVRRLDERGFDRRSARRRLEPREHRPLPVEPVHGVSDRDVDDRDRAAGAARSELLAETRLSPSSTGVWSTPDASIAI